MTGRLDTIDLAQNVVRAYRRATLADREAGTAWYPGAFRLVFGIAELTLADPSRVAHALAALSPRNPWAWNVADCYAFAHAASLHPTGPVPSATTFRVNREAAWRALTSPDIAPWTSAAPKVREFVAAIMGDRDAVVVDVWAMRVATAGRYDSVRPSEYQRVADAYRDAAVYIGDITPRALQAITWLVAQREGLGSGRKVRHDLTAKSSTAPAALALMRREGIIR